MAVALVTGASGGIGTELCDILAAHGYDLVLVARSEAKLRALSEKLEGTYGITAPIFPVDLAEPGVADTLHDALVEQGISVDVLANNAGFGDQGAFLDSDWPRQEEMVKLNILALMRLAYLFGNDMRRRGAGRILNVASVAAFTAGPYMPVYFASKAFVLSFSQALGEELRGSGVTVTALCPGTTATSFWGAAGMDAGNVFSLMGAQSPRAVAELGFNGLMAGKPVVIHSLPAKLANVAARLVPRRVSTWNCGQVLKRRG